MIITMLMILLLDMGTETHFLMRITAQLVADNI